MRRVVVNAGWIVLCVLAGMVVVAARTGGFAQGGPATFASTAQDKAAELTAAASSDQPGAAPSTTPAEKKDRSASGTKKAGARLPTYYAKVIDKEQRTKIVAIQEAYAAKMERLQRRIDALAKERDDKVAAVLTPEQQRKIDELKAAAQKARDDKKAAKDKPEK